MKDDSTVSLDWALDLLDDGVMRPPPNLLPLLPVDDGSIACVICAPTDNPEAEGAGGVVRWHLGDIPQACQAQLLDNDPLAYLPSVARELRNEK